MTKTNAIDPNVPASSESPTLGDNRIRGQAAGAAATFEVDHYMGTDGGAGVGYNEDAAGEHKKVTLREQASAPTKEANKGYVYTKAVSGKTELFYEDEDGNEIQISSGGILNSCNLTGDQTVDGVKTFSKQSVFTLGLTAAKALVSTLATGTAPLTVASATKVTNLNADKVDGYDVSAYSGGESYTFPGGLILKHGYKARSAQETTVTFGTAFPNNCVSVTATQYNTVATGETGSIQIETKSKTSFRVVQSEASMEGFYWQAWGY
jgi:hypothetical protein